LTPHGLVIWLLGLYQR